MCIRDSRTAERVLDELEVRQRVAWRDEPAVRAHLAVDGRALRRRGRRAHHLARALRRARQALGPLARLAYHPRLFNLLVSNIPGIQMPLYLLGRETEAFHACGFLAPRHALAVAAVSYNGVLGMGLICDPRAVPELDAIGAGIDADLDRLVAAARAPAPEPAAT